MPSLPEPPDQSGIADVGLIGLAVMGQNLALNLADHGHTVAVFNRTGTVTTAFLKEHPEIGLIGATTLAGLVAALGTPRRIVLMVKAGTAVDQTLDALLPLLEPGDVVIDGGNSFWRDTERRERTARAAGIRFLGVGISGGEEGARHGPSIMPGGDASGWPEVREMLQGIAAKTDDGTACCDWIGPGGSGHYVKMIHNGIEYGDMEVIAEAYQLMQGMGWPTDQIADVFGRFGKGRLDSYLIGITAEILRRRDADGTPLVEKILDRAGQKGTGKWAVDAALDLGQPLTMIAEAVFARVISSFKEDRMMAAEILVGPADARYELSESDIEDALYGSKIVSYAQGFMLLAAASSAYGWDLDLAAVAPLWREGCIIRAAFLDDITAAYRRNPSLINLMLDPFFADALTRCQAGWRRTVAAAITAGLPVPAYASALAFYDSYRSARLPANLIQAQRDYFGAHTYERVDRPSGEFFHTDW
ncbi:MAG TPA: decarboxylating NADP(+)-dependent phosphogluconate dehydrogenase [Acidimicrobiia bacterium]